MLTHSDCPMIQTDTEVRQMIDQLVIEPMLTGIQEERISIDQPADEGETFDLYRLACDMLTGSLR